MIRDALPGDWPAIWPIFEEIVRAGDAYAYPADTDKPTAEALWMTKPDHSFVFEHDGKILGTYYLKTNQEGPGKHVCNCGYMVSSVARGMGIARQMCEHSQGIVAQWGSTQCNSTSWPPVMTSPSHSGKNWASMLSEPCREPLTIRHWDWSMPL